MRLLCVMCLCSVLFLTSLVIFLQSRPGADPNPNMATKPGQTESGIELGVSLRMVQALQYA